MKNKPNIVARPPGKKARSLLEKDYQIISPSVRRLNPLFIESARDCMIKDVDGNEYIDFDSASAIMNVGHCHQDIVSAINQQSNKLIHYPWSNFSNEIILKLGEKLIDLSPGTFNKRIFYCSSNSEAIEIATKLLFWHTRKPIILAYSNSYHGETLAATSLTSDKAVRRRHTPKTYLDIIHLPYPYCYRCPFKLNYPECDYLCLEYIVDNVIGKIAPIEEISGLFFESIQGEGGIIVPPPEYFQKLKRLLDKYDILLVDDEAQTSMGRTGKWFGIENWKITPYMICFSNALASGLPLAVTISNADLMDWESESNINFVGGNTIACSVALQVIEVIKKERLLENSFNQGKYLVKRLNEMKETYDIIGDVRGKGLMIGVEIIKGSANKQPNEDEAKDIMDKCFRRGLVFTICGLSTLKITPPLTIKRDLIDEGLSIFEGVLKEVYRERYKKKS
ncbi:MAG: aminotransferase class III-fold pyridoxal phosphate-dependent enzyme [Candidatus Bathyarchaeota archaeon]|nr:aminotransferase class III-fold pyridoxal phosphate-dependent enzyme [Candidatus Bathyarchaeota archaeon]